MLFGALHTGSLLQLNDLHCLPSLLAIQLGDWLGVVFKALAKVPSFMAQARDVPEANATIAPSSIRSTPAPSSQKEASSTFEPIPEQDSSEAGSGSHHVHHFSTSYSSPDPRSTGTPTASALSQQSFRRPFPSQQSQMSNVPFTRSSSRCTVRLDWYQLLEEGKSRDVELWFGYGGETRRTIEVDKSVSLPVSPAFGCVLVGETPAKAIPEELKVRK